MAKYFFIIGTLIVSITNAIAQGENLTIKAKKYKTSDKSVIEGEVGYLTVPENRSNPESRAIKVKFIRLKSLNANPQEPIIYLEGGGGSCTWQAESPKDLTDWLPILEVADLIFVDRRGTDDRKLIHIQKGEFPKDFFVSEEAATSYYQSFVKEGLQAFNEKEVDVFGYNLEDHAADIHALTNALNIDTYSIFGFSFGTSIGMTLLKLYPENISNAVFVSADGPGQSFNYPSHLDKHFQKIADLSNQSEIINPDIPDLNQLLNKVMEKLEQDPAVVTIKHPLNKKSMDVKIGSFGLALILRLDIDDYYDIPVIPRLLYSINQGDYSLLQWFVQKRITLALGLPGNGLNQGIASGMSSERKCRILQEAEESPFGNSVNFPFGAAIDAWPEVNLSFDTSVPITSDVRTLFVTGDLDCRTPVEQVNELQAGFSNAIHLVVKNAGHEKALWNVPVFDEAIPKFLQGEDVSERKITLKRKEFIPVQGNAEGHPSLK